MTTDEKLIPNWVDNVPTNPTKSLWLEKFDPSSGGLLWRYADSCLEDVDIAVEAASLAFHDWSALTPVARGKILGEVASQMRLRAAELVACVRTETGKTPNDATGEVAGAIAQAEYFAGEGMRLYSRSLTSGMPGKFSHSIRQPHGVAALIVPANTPIANIAWKVFPALICGNTAVLKASEDAPRTAYLFAKICRDAGVPQGVLNVLQGIGSLVGAALVKNSRVDVISFTGSTAVGRWIAETAGARMARISLELGGKNPFIVCDDVDVDYAVSWASLSAFSNAGQRCAAGSRIIVLSGIYDEFKEKLINKAKTLQLGIEQNCDLGPVINLKQKNRILELIKCAETEGLPILCGGSAPAAAAYKDGYYITPTIIEDVDHTSTLCDIEIFGPVATLHRALNLDSALAMANSTQFGLTAAVHTNNVDRATWFAQKIRAGVVNINLGTYGSEPHMPFGGVGMSGNGSREPGVEALDVYSELKNVSFFSRLFTAQQ